MEPSLSGINKSVSTVSSRKRRTWVTESVSYWKHRRRMNQLFETTVPHCPCPVSEIITSTLPSERNIPSTAPAANRVHYDLQEIYNDTESSSSDGISDNNNSANEFPFLGDDISSNFADAFLQSPSMAVPQLTSPQLNPSSAPNTVQEDLNIINNFFEKHNLTRRAGNDLLRNVLPKLNPANLMKYPIDIRTTLPKVPKSDYQWRYFKDEDEDSSDHDGDGYNKLLRKKDMYHEKYVHIGIQYTLNKAVRKLFDKDDSKVVITVNFDGVKPFEKSRYDLWPISGAVNQFDPFLIGLYSGPGKPSNVSIYLHDFIEEVNRLEAEGIKICDKLYTFKLLNISADAPARIYILATKSYNAFHGCNRCKVLGFKVNGTTVFLGFNHPRRTAAEFIEGHGLHHKARSPLVDISSLCLPVDIVLDYMHLICLGIVPRWISFITGTPVLNDTLTLPRLTRVNVRLLQVYAFCPDEFARKPSSMDNLSNWKATDYRTFLLYLVPWLFRNIFPNPHHLENIQLLCIGVRLLIDPMTANDEKIQGFVTHLFEIFIINSQELYGDQFICYNVHSLIHLVEDVARFGALDNFSCFKFEDSFRKMTSWVHSGNKPLEQILQWNHRWLLQTSEDIKDENPIPSNPMTSSHFHNVLDNVGEYEFFKRLRFRNFLFRADNEADCYAYCGSGQVIKVKAIIRHVQMQEVQIIGRMFQKSVAAFTIVGQPSPGMYHVSALAEEEVVIKLTKIVTKCFVMPLDDNGITFFAAKLLHTG